MHCRLCRADPEMDTGSSVYFEFYRGHLPLPGVGEERARVPSAQGTGESSYFPVNSTCLLWEISKLRGKKKENPAHGSFPTQ